MAKRKKINPEREAKLKALRSEAQKASKEDLLKQYKFLAKKADRRLRDLEEAAETDKFKGITAFAYRVAMHDISSRWGGNRRFDTKAPDTLQGLRAKINDIQKFLLSDTSLKSKTLRLYKDRADTLNKKFGTDFTWQDLAGFWGSKAQKAIWDSYKNSALALKAVNLMTNNKAREKYEKQLSDKVETARKQGKEYFDIVGEAQKEIEKIMADNNLTIADLKR